MGDNSNRFRQIRKELGKYFSDHSNGNVVRHLNTLAGMISGIIASGSCQLPKIASKIPDKARIVSVEKRIKRLICNLNIDVDVYFLPFIEQLIKNLGLETIFLAIDGSGVGRECATLVVSIIYKKRALPIFWIVKKGKKGHFLEENHIQVMEQAHELMPKNVKKVIVLGDGEFDGVEFQRVLDGWGWFYCVRTGKNIIIHIDGEEWKAEFYGAILTPGSYIYRHDVEFTEEKYPVKTFIVNLEPGYDEPIYLISNIKSQKDVMRYYAKRFRIETFFSDQKSRGFNIHKSHLSDPDRLNRLMIAACLAYIWVVFLGVVAEKYNWREIIHRKDRCDLSLFQLGLRLLNYFLDHDKPIPISFTMNFQLTDI